VAIFGVGVEIAAIATEVAILDAHIPVGVNPVEIGEGKGLDTTETRIGDAMGCAQIVYVDATVGDTNGRTIIACPLPSEISSNESGVGR